MRFDYQLQQQKTFDQYLTLHGHPIDAVAVPRTELA